MEQIKTYLEQVISLTGLSGDSVAVVRYGILVIAAFVLAWLAGWLCRQFLVPILTARPDITPVLAGCAVDETRMIKDEDEKAAMRRDFTMNAMMEDVLTGEVLDFFGGRQDMQNRLIRHVNDQTYREDALRVLRAAQFAARFSFAGMEIKPAIVYNGASNNGEA